MEMEMAQCLVQNFFESHHPSRFITSQGDRHSTSPTMGVPLIMSKMVRFKRMQSKHWMILNHFFNNEQNKIISLMNNSCVSIYMIEHIQRIVSTEHGQTKLAIKLCNKSLCKCFWLDFPLFNQNIYTDVLT